MRQHICDSLVLAFKQGQQVYVDAMLLASNVQRRVKIVGASYEPDAVNDVHNKKFIAVGVDIKTASVVLLSGFDQGASINPESWTFQYAAINLMSPPHQWTDGDDINSAKLQKQIEVETQNIIAYFGNLFIKE